ESMLLEQVRSGAAGGIGILNTNSAQRHCSSRSRSSLRKSRPQPTNHGMILAGDHKRNFLDVLQNPFLVERFQRTHMDEGRSDAFLVEIDERRESMAGHQTQANDEHVGSIAVQHFGSAQFEAIVILVKEYRNLSSLKPHVYRSFEFSNRLRGLID